MKAGAPQLERALVDPAGARFFLFHGPDEAGSRAQVKRLAEAIGADAERIDLTGAELKADPARLADEAAAFSMFGDKRWILVEPAGDEIVPALEALAEAPVAGNSVAIVAGALRPASKLLKLALAEPRAISFASYAPEGRNADRMVAALARERGLAVRDDVARRIAEACAANRALVERELDKLALYLDASAEAPKALDHDALDAVGAGNGEADLARLVDSVAGGDSDALEAELARLRAEGREGIPLIRAVQRRLVLLARLRAEVERGRSVGDVMASSGKSMFWKEKDSVGPQLARWRSDLIARALGRLVEAERQVMASGGPGPIAADAQLAAICRRAARMR